MPVTLDADDATISLDPYCVTLQCLTGVRCGRINATGKNTASNGAFEAVAALDSPAFDNAFVLFTTLCTLVQPLCSFFTLTPYLLRLQLHAVTFSSFTFDVVSWRA